jgi:tripartite-type tricarboxylate transporter receptor subunit TctC
MMKKLGVLLAGLAVGAAAFGADFPSQPVKLVVPLGAGSATDIMARTVAKALEAEWKQPVLVENRPGAGGILAADFVSKQPADGHTLLLTGPSVIIAPLIDRNANFRLDRDLTPVARLAVLRIVLATNTNVPARTLQEFAAYSRTQPGKLNYGGLGRTSIIDIGIEVLKRGLNMDVTPVTYKGAAEHNVALIRDDVQLVWGGASVLREQAATGKVRILAAVSDKRFAELPDVPTVVEAGHAGFIPRVWTGLVAPARTPQAVQDQIVRDVNRVLARPEVAQALQGPLGNDPAPLPPGAFAEDVRKESRFWADLFRELKIEPQ